MAGYPYIGIMFNTAPEPALYRINSTFSPGSASQSGSL
jgi:hypothetical protein